jgi:hypothetical protein
MPPCGDASGAALPYLRPMEPVECLRALRWHTEHGDDDVVQCRVQHDLNMRHLSSADAANRPSPLCTYNRRWRKLRAAYHTSSVRVRLQQIGSPLQECLRPHQATHHFRIVRMSLRV